MSSAVDAVDADPFAPVPGTHAPTVNVDRVQRIVLSGMTWGCGQQLLIHGSAARGDLRRFLALMLQHGWPHAMGSRADSLQVSIGLTRRGLERAGVRSHVLALLALKAPAFWAGAAHRAALHTGASGANSPNRWEDRFNDATLLAVVTVHAEADDELDRACARVDAAAHGLHLSIVPLERARRLPAPEDLEDVPGAQWVHFGFRDGLSRIGIEGVTPQRKLATLKPFSRHQPGEFVLGHPEDSGARPWLSSPGLGVWPAVWRDFFRDGSFGVLLQMSQDVPAFERFVADAVDGGRAGPLPGETPEARRLALKAKLCGRHPDGHPLGDDTPPKDDFDYRLDPDGRRCPFGSHVRRMSPRAVDRPHDVGGDQGLAHGARSRTVIRRGMPYGPPWQGDLADTRPRGLMGQFFCASIEDQFEHLMGQWADRVPMGSPDRGGARDPLIGAHEPGDGPFELPQGPNRRPVFLQGLQPFTRTLGMAYLFYPGRHALAAIAQDDPLIPPEEDRG